MESVLGLHPHEFESRILRSPEQEKRQGRPPRGPALSRLYGRCRLSCRLTCPVPARLTAARQPAPPARSAGRPSAVHPRCQRPFGELPPSYRSVRGHVRARDRPVSGRSRSPRVRLVHFIDELSVRLPRLVEYPVTCELHVSVLDDVRLGFLSVVACVVLTRNAARPRAPVQQNLTTGGLR